MKRSLTMFCAVLSMAAAFAEPRSVLKISTPSKGQIFAQNSTLTVTWDYGTLDLVDDVSLAISDRESGSWIPLPDLPLAAKSHTYYLEHADRYPDDRYDVKDEKGGAVLATLLPGEETRIHLVATLYDPKSRSQKTETPVAATLFPTTDGHTDNNGEKIVAASGTFTVLPFPSQNTRQTIRGRVGIRMQARILGLNGAAIRKGHLLPGLTYHRDSRKLVGRPTRTGRRTVFFLDQNDAQTVVTLIVRKSPPRQSTGR